jgi:hypothetical protein
MPWLRPAALLAILAALMMAPSAALGAAPNELQAADVSPTSGTTSTVFVLSVAYRSHAGNPAQAVTASVAGLDVPLSLVGGTAIDGTWRGATRLPAGSWTVAFLAQVAKGPQPTARYGIVSVAGGSSTPPSSGLPSGSVDGGTGGAASAQPAPQVTETPMPSTRPAASGQTTSQAPKSSAAPAAGPQDGSVTEGGRHPRPQSRRTPASSASGFPAVAARLPGSGPSKGQPRSLSDEPQLVWLVLALGLSGVAAVALLGTGWVLIGARSQREEELVPAQAAEPDLASRAIPAVERRALRRARLRSSNDPILASMGLEDLDGQDATGSTQRSGRGRGRKVQLPQDD